MELLLLLLSITVVRLSFCTAQSSSDTTIDFQVGVILDLNSTDYPVGLIGKSCLSMAHSDFYSVHKDFKTRLELHFMDSNGSVVDAAAAALDLLKDVKVDAIIGPQKSTQANFVMDLGDRARVPIISFSATSPSLSPRSPYFVQTAQSDANQVQAIASIVKAFQWSQVVIINEDSEYGNGIVPYLSNALHDVNARVSYRSVFPISATDNFISKELYKMMNMQTRVFVVNMSQSLGIRFFLKLRELGMMSDGYAWIVTSGLTDLFSLMDIDVVEAMQGVLGVKPLIPKSKELQSFASRWIRMFLLDNQGMKVAETSIFGLWAYDTLWALAMAAERVGNRGPNAVKNENDSANPFSLETSDTGPKLLESLLNTRFAGLAGEFKLVNGQLEQTSYQIVNFVGKNEREVGIWRPSGGIYTQGNQNATTSRSTSMENFRSIIWPGDSTIAPKGWEIPLRGKKLRIGVPQKPGFNEFLKVETDPKTNATIVSGFYKKVFESVMAALPYAVLYEYVPYPFFNSDGSIAGSYDDLVYQVSLQERYDAAIGDITITANRSIYADFTMPFAEGGVTFIVPIKYEDDNDMFAFLKPLTKELWLMTAVFYILTAIACWILGSMIVSNSKEIKGQHPGMICYFPFFPGEGIESNLFCLVSVTWILVASWLNSIYTANLSSRLTVQRLQPTVTDVAQLIKNGDYVGCQEGSFLVSFLINLGINESKIRTYNSTNDSTTALSLGSENGGISAYCDVLPHIRFILSHNDDKYMMVGPIHRTDGFAFAFPSGSPFVADVSRAIIQLTENSNILAIEPWPSNNSVGSVPGSNGDPTSVTLRSFLVPFVITGCVTLTCLLVSLLAYLYKNTAFLQKTSDFSAKLCSRIHALSKYLKLKHGNPSWLPKTSNTRDQIPKT